MCDHRRRSKHGPHFYGGIESGDERESIWAFALELTGNIRNATSLRTSCRRGDFAVILEEGQIEGGNHELEFGKSSAADRLLNWGRRGPWEVGN